MRNIVPGAPFDASPLANVLPGGPGGVTALSIAAAPAAIVQGSAYIPVPGPKDTQALNLLPGKLDAAQKGAANGVATLDSTGKVPSNQLPPIPTTLPDGDGILSSINGERIFTERLPPAAFPVVANDGALPLGGAARVGETLRYRRPDGSVVQFGDFNTVNAQVQDRLDDLTGALTQTDVALADIAQTTAGLQAAAAGAVPYVNFAAFPSASGYNGKAAWAGDTGFVYKSNGATWVKTGEVATTGAVQAAQTAANTAQSQLDRIVADTLNVLGQSAGRVNGEVRHINGVPYVWDNTSTRTADGIATIAAAATPTGRWLLPEADFGLHPKRAGAKCDGVTDDTVAVLNTINLANTLGTFVQWTGTMLLSALTITSSVTILGQGATIIPNRDGLTGRGALITVDGTGKTIERVNIVGVYSDGGGVRCKFLSIVASTTTAGGIVRKVNISNNVITGYWDQAVRIGLGQKADGSQWVEDVLIKGNVIEDCGPFLRLNATGTSGSTALTFISADGRPIAGRVPIGAAFKLAGGTEIYRVTAFNSGTGAATISPALTRSIDRQYVFQVEETQPLAGGTAGSTALTLSTTPSAILVGSKLTMNGVRGEYTVTAIAGTSVTLNKPLIDSPNIAFTRVYSGGAYCQGIYLDPFVRRATLTDNTLRNSSGSMVFKSPFTGDQTLYEDGEIIISNNRISYGYMLIEFPALSQDGVTGTRPTLTGTAGGTILTVGNGVNLTTCGVGIGAIISLGPTRGVYQITAATSTTWTVSRYSMATKTQIAGGLVDNIAIAAPISVVTRADGIPGISFAMPRLSVQGNTLTNPTRDDYGYCISAGGDTVAFSGNICTTWNRPVFELMGRSVTIANNSTTIRNYEGAGTAGFGVANTSQPPFAWGNIGFGTGTVSGNTVEMIPGSNTSQFWNFINLYGQFGLGFDTGEGTFNGNVVNGLQGAFVNVINNVRYDGMTIQNNIISAPTATGSIIRAQGTRWRVRGNDFYLPVGDTTPILRDPDPSVPVLDVDFTNNVIRTNRRVQTLNAGLARTTGNTYITVAGAVSYDPAYVSSDYALELLKANSLLDNYVLADLFNRADSATLGTSSSGAVWNKLTGVTGDFSIVGGVATNATSTEAVQGRTLTAVAGSTDGSVEAIMGGGGVQYLYGRTTDQYNFWRFGADSYSLDGTTGLGNYYLMWRTGGAPTYIANVAGLAKAGDRLRLEFKGTTISAYLNGVLFASTVSTVLQSATFFGMQGKLAGANPAKIKSVMIRQG